MYRPVFEWGSLRIEIRKLLFDVILLLDGRRRGNIRGKNRNAKKARKRVKCRRVFMEVKIIKFKINLLATDFFFQILAHPVSRM